MSESALYTILISTYECKGFGVEYLEQNLHTIITQTYRPIQVIISDHSRDNEIQRLVESIPESSNLEIRYKRYTEQYGNASANWNNALLDASGEFIHYLAMDDMLADTGAIDRIVSFMTSNPNSKWIASETLIIPGRQHFIPSWNPYVWNGNTISGPSAVTIRKSLKHIRLDEKLRMYLDIDWYYRLYLEAGKPLILNSITWVNRTHPNQLTYHIDEGELKRENCILLQKYKNTFVYCE